jgi:hypothetical protein
VLNAADMADRDGARLVLTPSEKGKDGKLLCINPDVAAERMLVSEGNAMQRRTYKLLRAFLLACRLTWIADESAKFIGNSSGSASI